MVYTMNLINKYVDIKFSVHDMSQNKKIGNSNNLKFWEAIKSKGLNKIAKINHYGHLMIIIYCDRSVVFSEYSSFLHQ